ncbi:MliC family protein [Devosia sp. 2618]|uniref:MliC family protein n=1 Tax=Devosia sp. 2618 TaxID=3156454 RepID=UPI00339308EF
MKYPMIATAMAAMLLTPIAANAVESSLQLQIGSGDLERHIVSYECGAEAPLVVTYINAAPNFLAIVPVLEEAEPLLFASVISASGARYASGKWIWWNAGIESGLYDATLGEDAEPVLTCSEIINTP